MGSAEVTHRLGTESKRTANNRIPASTILILAGLLTGCIVGPDFKRPAAPYVTDYSF